MKIALLLPDLRPGGAEHMHVHMADHWSQMGFETEFVLCRKQGELLASLPQCSTVVDLQAKRVRNSLLPLVNYLRQRKPDALLAAMWPLTVIAPLAANISRFSGKVVISEHAPLSLGYAGQGYLHGRLMAASMRAFYAWAEARVGVSHGVADDMARLSGLPRDAFTVIHNPAASRSVLPDYLRPDALGDQPGFVVLSVGTLKAVKRHDVLIRAFAGMGRADARLFILGEGSERGRLESLVRELGLEGRVLLPGYQPDTAPWYAHADLFVLSSDHEGFGNVIVEALEQGTPVVSTDCPSGPREILEDGKYGTLVPVGDVDALAKALDEALSRDHDREALKRRAQDFSVDKAADAYLDLLLPGWRGGLQ